MTREPRYTPHGMDWDALHRERPRRRYWSARAQFSGDREMTFGIEAPDEDTALELAKQRTGHRNPVSINVTEIPPRGKRGTRDGTPEIPDPGTARRP